MQILFICDRSSCSYHKNSFTRSHSSLFECIHFHDTIHVSPVVSFQTKISQLKRDWLAMTVQVRNIYSMTQVISIFSPKTSSPAPPVPSPPLRPALWAPSKTCASLNAGETVLRSSAKTHQQWSYYLLHIL